MRELVKQRSSSNLTQTLRADYALFHLEADVRWMDITAARLKQFTKEIQSAKQ